MGPDVEQLDGQSLMAQRPPLKLGLGRLTVLSNYHLDGVHGLDGEYIWGFARPGEASAVKEGTQQGHDPIWLRSTQRGANRTAR